MKLHSANFAQKNPSTHPASISFRRPFQRQIAGREREGETSGASACLPIRRAVQFGLGVFLVVAALTLTRPTRSQEYTFTTLAGRGGGAGAIDGMGQEARFSSPSGVAVDSAGNAYVADEFNHTVRKITPGGAVTTLAGLAGSHGSSNGTGSAARFNEPMGVALDSAGNVFVADQQNHTIRKITPTGMVTTLAGRAGLSGSADGGSTARFNQPGALAVDSAGNVYVADCGNSTVRKISSAGIVTTVAGVVGSPGSADGPGSQAQFDIPFAGIAVDGAGNIYIADFNNSTIRKITPDGMVTTLAGSAGQVGSADGTGSTAQFSGPPGLAVDGTGNVYVADDFNQAIRKITPDGLVTTLAGDPTVLDQDGNPLSGFADGTPKGARFYNPVGVAVDGAGNVYVADAGNQAIRQVTPSGIVTTLAGTPSLTGSNDGVGPAAQFNYPTSVTADQADNLFVTDAFNHTIRKVTSSGIVTTLAGLAGSPGSDDGVGVMARFNYPVYVLSDNGANLYVADGHNETIRRVTASGIVTTLAGAVGITGADDGAAKDARFNAPRGMAVDRAGNLYVLDRDNHTLRKMTPAGEVTTLAGLAGVPGSDDGTGVTARFQSPRGLAIDSADNLYVADSDNHAIRKVTPAGVVTTLAGLPGTSGSANGTGRVARFDEPFGIAADSADNLYVADTSNNTIRKVTPSGVVTTVAGIAGTYGSTDGGGDAARFNQPDGIVVDSAGNLYVTDSINNTIRVGTKTCLDQPTIDLTPAPAGQTRQLDTNPQTATSWQWSIIRRPANSVAVLSAVNVRNPTFTPDVADLYVFQLRATTTDGAICIRTLSFAPTPAPPSIVASSLSLANRQFSFNIRSSVGSTVEIQSSTDLSNWTGLVTVTNLTGTASFTDPAASSASRFYRLRQ